MLIVVGTENGAKLRAVEMAATALFGPKQFTIQPVRVPSGVSNQPFSDDETILGAQNRARNALLKFPDAEYGIGLEGGLQKIQDRWKDGKMGMGSSARFEISEKIIAKLQQGKELAEVMDELTGKTDVRSNDGAMGVVTNGCLKRDVAYSHGVLFAFAPFVSDSKYWV